MDICIGRSRWDCWWLWDATTRDTNAVGARRTREFGDSHGAIASSTARTLSVFLLSRQTPPSEACPARPAQKMRRQRHALASSRGWKRLLIRTQRGDEAGAERNARG